jgi:hypothetical protein
MQYSRSDKGGNIIHTTDSFHTVVKSYEMVRTFNNFKASVTFAMKKSEALLILVEKF